MLDEIYSSTLFFENHLSYEGYIVFSDKSTLNNEVKLFYKLKKKINNLIFVDLFKENGSIDFRMMELFSIKGIPSIFLKSEDKMKEVVGFKDISNVKENETINAIMKNINERT